MPQVLLPTPLPPVSTLALSWGHSRTPETPALGPRTGGQETCSGLCPALQHEGICTFPSMEFYNGKLKTWQGLRRPPSVLGHIDKESCPVIFGHVQGHEQSLLVSTDEGNENSKANLEEVTEVVSVGEAFPAAPWSRRASWRRRQRNRGNR